MLAPPRYSARMRSPHDCRIPPVRRPRPMKITTWNVNGLRARLNHVIGFLREHRPDVLCLHETKVPD